MNFIILSSNEKNIKGYENIINKTLLKEEIEYEDYKFNDINKLKKFIHEYPAKNIYIIENNNKINAEEVIREVRITNNDYVSFIIIIDFDKNLKLLEHKILTTVIEDENITLSLTSALKELVKIYRQSPTMLDIRQNGINYRIPFCDILYIEKISNSKYCKIVCKNKKYMVKETLNNVMERLNKSFILVHRSVCANIEEINIYDSINNIIIFKNNEQLTLVSREKKKDLVKAITEQGQIFTK